MQQTVFVPSNAPQDSHIKQVSSQAMLTVILPSASTHANTSAVDNG